MEGLAMRYKEDIIDLKATTEGFAREFDRI